ncbi:MAG: glycosyltransferase family 4 protein [Dehalococcoidales bacterium]|nr:glycosyltransferase family 4 protein [Dehalococcoidales bacterium]
MKIIHVVATYPPQLGGMESAVKELAERTARKGHDVTVITSSFRGNKKTEDVYVKVLRLWSIRIPGIPVIIPTLPLILFKLINRDTIVHIHYLLNPSIDIAIGIAILKRCKIAVHVHIDPLPSSPLGFLNPVYKKIIWGKVLPLPNCVICPTIDYVKSVSCKYKVSEGKCVAIPYGIDTKNFRQKSSLDISTPVKILSVGRMHRQKNVPRLLEAFRLFQKKLDAVLHIVGDGEERQSIEVFIKNNAIPNVIMEGELHGTRLADLYASSDIFLLTSDFESFGIVNLEAMASSLPIIASDIPGVRTLLEGSAILVKPTPENFAEAMLKLVESKQLRVNLVNRGYEKVAEYDWDKITERMIELYHSISTSRA